MTACRSVYTRVGTTGVVALLLALFLAVPPASAFLLDSELPREERVRNLNLIAAGTIVTWGVVNWDYFQRSPQSTSEGWFGQHTDEGGVDKLGHLYTAYALSHLYASIYRDWEYPAEKAMRLGALSSLGTVTIMELGDSFSSYGFSYEDMIINCVGAAAGYWLGSYPAWQQRLDLRVEYLPSLSNFEADLFTDYEHFKYLLALKAEGFAALNDTPLRYLELHLGYYSRGYRDYQPLAGVDERERTLYVGVGLNVGKIIERIWETRLFDYLQLPYTYLPLEHRLDR